MNITPLFSTPEREKILDYMLDNPKEKVTMRQIAKQLSVSASQVHKYFVILRKLGIIRKMEVQDNYLVRSLRIMQNMKKLKNANIVSFLRKKIPGLKGIGVFGSWAEGTNMKGSDLDIWIKVEKEPELLTIAKTRKELEATIGVDIDLIILDKIKIKRHMEKNPPFYFSLFYSILLYGEKI